MAFPNGIYAPPGVYTQTNLQPPNQGAGAAARLPLIIGPGSEILTQTALEIVRGSSASVDQRVVQEDEAGRAVVSISPAGQITLGAFDGTLDHVQVRNYPIVSGNGSGTKKFVRIAARSSPTRSGVHDSARTPAVSRDPDNSNLMAARTRRGVKKIPMQSHPFGKHDFITSEIGFGAGCTAAGSPEHSLALPFPPSLVFFAP